MKFRQNFKLFLFDFYLTKMPNFWYIALTVVNLYQQIIFTQKDDFLIKCFSESIVFENFISGEELDEDDLRKILVKFDEDGKCILINLMGVLTD